MSVHLVTFSTPDFERSRALCVSSGLLNGVTHTHPCEPEVLPPDMQRYCEGKRGFGYWQWKPMVIEIAMRGCEEGSTLIYADVGVEFIDNVSHIVSNMSADIWLFGNLWQHLHWCKMDAIKAVCSDIPLGRFNKQGQASVIFFRVSDWSRAFVKEWLNYCLQPHLIDDLPSLAQNHNEFREHRHDQALLTCLAYKYGIPLHWWPAVYNRFTGPEFVYEKGEYVDTYPPLFHHHRLRDHEFQAIHVLA